MTECLQQCFLGVERSSIIVMIDVLFIHSLYVANYCDILEMEVYKSSFIATN